MRFIDDMDLLCLYILIDRIYHFPVLQGVATKGENSYLVARP